jgi:hypothetical protein
LVQADWIAIHDEYRPPNSPRSARCTNARAQSWT